MAVTDKKGRVADKIALVTGGADGIGLAVAKLLAQEGAKVIIADINDAKGVLAAKLVRGTFLHLDVSNEASWQEASNKIKAKFGRLNILVNNAGILGQGAQDPEHVTLADWRKIHAINLDSVFLGCKYAIGLMKKSGGSIVNMSSRSGIVGVPFAAPYASTKAGVRNHTKSVALYCAAKNYPIRCNSVHPASIMTEMWKAMLGTGQTFKKNLKHHSEHIPMKRFGTVLEVAQAVLFLASAESSYTTGSELVVDGGTLAGTLTSPDTNIKKKV
ncbi:MAG: short-chain dehydrogenase [Candidatus Vogelbacteria bacterium RIFOXYD1_FULL_44_32]|uniref:Short-chain dehydrogenase n=1 Tax=Candidatus Vogelbacteria bacterium RIFOXYD1_FULL_44_32 TaxID=1802438 RepID=A0A1G2QDB2_9BACT|nr:MAG: short-chain dehydrogenase [Candidatus Vogelbacteria bacterium RIFOXYD1_FULL_44_32]